MAPGDVQPVLLGITLPSFAGWFVIYLGLIVLVLLIQLAVWAYYNDVGDRQYADPETRSRMNLGARVSILGNRMRPALERLAEPERSRALRLANVLDVMLYGVIALAAMTLALYVNFVH